MDDFVLPAGVPADVVAMVANLVAAVHSTPAPDYEVEARFGTLRDTGGFAAGVSADFFARCLAGLEASDKWGAPPSGWVTFVDFFYSVEGVGEVRTTRRHPPAGGGNRPVHVVKQPLGNVDVRLHPSQGILDVSAPAALRASVKREKTLAAASLPDVVEPTYVRVKRRKTFTGPRRRWKYELSKIWSGKSLAEVERTVDAGGPGAASPQYEVEVELGDFRAYVAENSDEYTAASLMMKMLNFMSTAYEATLA